MTRDRDDRELLAHLAELPIDLQPETLEYAEELLSSLASALFQERSPGRSELTWPDRPIETLSDGAPRESIEDRLRRAEARFRTLVEQIPAVTFMAVLGDGENEVYVSPHIEHMLGYTQEEWLSDPFLWYNRLHPADRASWNEEFARGCRTGGPFRTECRFIARNGTTVWVHGEARLVRDDRGRPQFLQGVAFDVTESKKAQKILLEHAISTARLEEELAIARRVQTSILPQNPTVPGLAIGARMHPADEVGGDYYDILPTRDGAWLAIGDVSGHGLDAGLIMLMVQSAMAGIAKARKVAKPRDALCLLNEVLYENVQRLQRDQYVTLCLMHYTLDGHVLFAGAHQDILLCRKKTGNVERIKTPGTWLGLRKDIQNITHDSHLTLHEGDIMVLFTDGIIEAMNAAGEQFDMARLCEALRAYRMLPPDEIVEGILARVRAWASRQDDDMTLIAVRYGS